MRSSSSAAAAEIAHLGKGLKMMSANEAWDDILRGTTQDHAFGPEGVVHVASIALEDSGLKGYLGGRKKKVSSSALSRRDNKDFGSADEAQGGSISGSSWCVWAASLGRSISARSSTVRQSSAAPINSQQSAQCLGSQRERDTIDMPDVAALPSARPRPASKQPIGISQTAATTEYASVNGLAAAFKAKTKGSRELLTALSNASRPSSHIASNSKEPALFPTEKGRTNNPLQTSDGMKYAPVPNQHYETPTITTFRIFLIPITIMRVTLMVCKISVSRRNRHVTLLASLLKIQSKSLLQGRTLQPKLR